MATKRQPKLEPLEKAVGHVRGPAAGHLVVEYGDYACPDSLRAFREIERVEHGLSGGIRFAFRHFPLTAASAAPAAARACGWMLTAERIGAPLAIELVRRETVQTLVATPGALPSAETS